MEGMNGKEFDAEEPSPNSGSSLAFERENAIDGTSCSLKGDDLDKSVRFGSVTIRGYALCLGDSPSVSRGAPIALDWKYGEEYSCDLNSYEDSRSRDKKHAIDLKIPSLQRLRMLKDWGYSRSEIKQQTKRSEREKQKWISTRRKLERGDAAKKFVRAMGDMLDISKPVKKFWCHDLKTKNSESENDTLGSSASSRKSDFSELTVLWDTS